MITLWQSFAKEHAERIKSPPGKIKVDIKEVGTMHGAAGKNLGRKMAMTLHDCPDFYVDNEGRFTNPTWWRVDGQ